jgi:NTP pyrophosphatase (non-canonical NTP hydrolase)
VKTLREMSAEIREVNTALGWRERINPWGDYCALINEELGEITQAYRRHKLADATRPVRDCDRPPVADSEPVPPKPEGVGSECADVLIRLIDHTDCVGIDCYDMARTLADVDPVYPASGAPSTVGGWVAWLHKLAARLYPYTGDEPPKEAYFHAAILLRGLAAFCEQHDVDLMAEYERKIAYNRTREYKHGGKVM